MPSSAFQQRNEFIRKIRWSEMVHNRRARTDNAIVFIASSLYRRHRTVRKFIFNRNHLTNFVSHCWRMAAITQLNRDLWYLASRYGWIDLSSFYRHPGAFGDSMIVYRDLPLGDGSHGKNESENSDTASKNIFWVSIPSTPAWVLGFMYFISGRFAVAIGLIILVLVVDHFVLGFIIYGSG